jgi:hypothetical protein
MSDNKRIIDVNEHIESEALAPVTILSWEPALGPTAATITFQCSRYFRYKLDGSYFGAPQSDGAISVSATQLLGRNIPVMLPGGQIVGEYPAELLDGLMRGLFHMLYNEMR